MSVLELGTLVYALATVVIMVIAGATAWWAKGQFQEVKKARQLNCLTGLSERWSSDLIREARKLADSAQSNFDQVWRDLETEHSPNYFMLAALANFFEDLGILEKENQITFEQVVDRFGPTLVYYHDIYEGFISEKQKEDPRILENFDELVRRIQRKTIS